MAPSNRRTAASPSPVLNTGVLTVAFVLGVVLAVLWPLWHVSTLQGSSHLPGPSKQDQPPGEGASDVPFAIETEADPSKRPKILLSIAGWDDWLGPGDAIFRHMNCSFLCESSTDLALWDVSEAIVFHTLDAYWPLPPRRPTQQKWVFFMLETPLLGAVTDERIDDVFNWTMTYHRKSDIWFPYGNFARRPTSVPMQAVPTKRAKMAAWMVSHCETQSKREVLAEKLANYVSVTQYGKCNGNPCIYDGVTCLKRLREEHYFYLAWENALCDDYVTEKLWDALAIGFVPVVYGGADYEQMLPPHSFIDAMSFNTVKDLADYLIYLSSNATAYQEYLQWTEDYAVGIPPERAWCDLCEKLYRERVAPTITRVKSVEYWAVERHCTRKEKDMERLLHSRADVTRTRSP